MANFYKLASLKHIEILTPKSCDLPKKHNGESNEQKVGKPVSIDSFYFYHNTLRHSLLLSYLTGLSLRKLVTKLEAGILRVEKYSS